MQVEEFKQVQVTVICRVDWSGSFGNKERTVAPGCNGSYIFGLKTKFGEQPFN